MITSIATIIKAKKHKVFNTHIYTRLSVLR
nr:MAG TPA: hypothetical protein [Bacteriophage sp.]